MKKKSVEFGKQFKEHRIKNQLTLKQVADYVGYKSTQNVSMIENGTTTPDYNELVKFCKLYGLNLKIMSDLVAKIRYLPCEVLLKNKNGDKVCLKEKES